MRQLRQRFQSPNHDHDLINRREVAQSMSSVIRRWLQNSHSATQQWELQSHRHPKQRLGNSKSWVCPGRGSLMCSHVHDPSNQSIRLMTGVSSSFSATGPQAQQHFLKRARQQRVRPPFKPPRSQVGKVINGGLRLVLSWKLPSFVLCVALVNYLVRLFVHLVYICMCVFLSLVYFSTQEGRIQGWTLLRL